MSCKVLISTTVGWTSTARHAWGFAASGCIVDAVAPAGAPVTQSRHVSKCHSYRSVSGRSSLRAAIREARPDLVVSCDDRAAENLVQLYGLEPKGSPIAEIAQRSLGTPRSYPALIARESFMRTARALGVRTPDTLPVPDEAALAACLREIGLPAVLKADGSWGGDGVAVVRTLDQARTAFRRLAYPPSALRSLARALRRRDGHWVKAAIAPQRRAISVQRFIEGRSAASAFAAWNGEVVGAVFYDVLLADGAVGPPSVIQRVDCPEIAQATRLIAQHYGLSGLHGLDFIRDSSGHVHLLEINPRATQGGTLHFGPGRDLAAALTSRLSACAKLRPSIPNDTVVFFPTVWVNNPASTYLKDGYHDVPWDDPMVLRMCLADASPAATVEKFIRESAATEFNADFGLSGAVSAGM
jgi:hypothetical protein